MKAKLVTFEPAGLNNRTDSVDLLPIEMVTAENVDLRRGKSARRRKGGTQVLAGKFFSFWDNGSTSYVGKDASGVFTLNEFLPDFSLRELSSLSVGTQLAYEQVNGVTAVSNGVDLGFIVNNTFTAPTVPTATHMRATVAGEHLSEQNGRLLIGRGASIYFTITHDLETMDERFCQIPLPETLKMMVALKTGVWVSYGGVIAFLAGAGPDDYKFTDKANYSAVRGTAKKTKASLFKEGADGDAVIFMTSRGPCLGTEQGELVEMSEQQISAGDGQFGAGMVRLDNGYTHYVGSIQDPGTAPNQYVPKTISVDSQS